MGKEVVLPSGAKAVINAAPFADAYKLWQACAKELARLNISATTEVDYNLFKNIFCVATSSAEIDAALGPCLRWCLYSGFKIDETTFEKEDARQDYFPVVEEVLKSNILPFLKGLLQRWGIKLGQVTQLFPTSTQNKTT